jgi:sec-independent protein translocase protein TatA
MFGSIGLPELLVIFVIALMVFGPSKLPELGKSLGEAIRGFKRSLSDAEKTPAGVTEQKKGPAKTV